MVNKRLSYLIKFIYSPVDDNMHIKRRELIKEGKLVHWQSSWEETIDKTERNAYS